jgi:MoxR-like ATPase
MDRRGYATPDDVQKMAPYVLEHRLLLTQEARLKSITAAQVITGILSDTPLPEA